MKRVPLTRKTPLATNKALSGVKALKRGDTPKRPRRNTGPSVIVRQLVINRACGVCERCGQPIRNEYSIHHRKPRGMGGTSDTSVNSAANLVLLCGSATTPSGCHTGVERFRQASAVTGFIVARTADPAAVPIKMHHGWVLLGHDGSMTRTERPEEP